MNSTNGTICPRCKIPMVVRLGKFGKFLGCTSYPKCKHTQNIPVVAAAKKTFKPSKYQQAIYDYILDPKGGDAVIEAAAGSGKTTTLEHAIEYAKGTLAFFAFNKAIVKELRSRVSQGVVQTLHSAGYQTIRDTFSIEPEVEGKKKYILADELLPDIAEDRKKGIAKKSNRAERSLLVKLTSLVQNTLTDETDEDAIVELIDHYGIATDGLEDVVLPLISGLIALCLKRIDMIDYDDMIFMPIRMNLPILQYDWVMLDEEQDVNKCQLQFVLRSVTETGRIIGVGDSNQCQPAGTLVRLTGGELKPIEQIKIGDELASYSRESAAFVGLKYQGRKVLDVSSRYYQGDLIQLTAEGNETQCTPNHKWLTRFNTRSRSLNVTYLMRQGDRFRVGWCQLFNSVGDNHLGYRARIEQADCAWILTVHDNKREASAWESIIAGVFGLPMLPFKEACQAEYLNQDNIDFIFNKIDDLILAWPKFDTIRERASSCLSYFNRDIRYPFWNKCKRKRQGRTTLFITEACNLLPDIMSVPVYDPTAEILKGRRSNHPAWTSIKIEYKEVSQQVYSLQVETHAMYIADNIATHNSVFGFRGADVNAVENIIASLSNVKIFPLPVSYRCPRSHIRLAQRIVPEIQWCDTAEEGIIEYDVPTHKVISETKSGDMILCRLNAPLVSLAFAFIRAGKKAVIRGRNIGDNLIQLIDKLHAVDMPDLYMKLKTYRRQESDKLARAGKEELIERISDTVNTIIALGDGATRILELKTRIDDIFSDDIEGVVLSSVHKTKGLEAESVYILEPGNMPFPMAKKDWQIKQEFNLLYVALTRSMHKLSFIEGRPTVAIPDNDYDVMVNEFDAEDPYYRMVV